METRNSNEMKMVELEEKLMQVWQFAFDNAPLNDEQDNNVNVCITSIQAEMMEVRKAAKELK